MSQHETKLPFDAATDAKKTLSDPVAFEAYMSLLEETAKELADFDKPYTARSIRQAVAMILLLRSAEQPNSMACENVGPHPLGGGTEGMCPHHEQPKDDKREALAIELAQWRGHGQREKTYDEADRILALLGDAKQASDDTEEEREGDFRVDAQRLPNCHAQGTLFWNNLVGASNEYAGDDILEKCVCENPDSKICLYCRLWEIRNTDFLAGVEWLLQRWAKFTVNDDAILDAAEQAWQITEGWANLSHRPRPTTRERLKETIGAALARREAE